MIRQRTGFALVLAVALAGIPIAWADEEDEDRAALVKELPNAKVSLQDGLRTSEREGRPISGKLEVDEGKFQLSVYTIKDGKFFEVIADPKSGAVSKVEPITEGEDLSDAKEQNAAMAKAKIELKAAVDKAERDTSGFRAVRVTPELKGGRPQALVVLVKGDQFKSVPESLE